MAKQRRAVRREGGTRDGGGGRTGLVLALVAAVAGGGVLLYRHTTPYQGSSREGASSAGSSLSRPEVARQQPVPALAPPVGGEPGQLAAPMAPGVSAMPNLPGATETTKRPLPQAPFGESEEVFETGAKVYVAHCASCHGQPGRVAPAAGRAVQLWDSRAGAAQRTAAEPAGVLYEQIAEGVAAANGAPAMAGYRHVLSETQMWDVVLLLRNAGQELPDPVVRLLRAPVH